MASFDECLQFAIHNCPILHEKKIELKDKQLQTLKALYEVKDCISVLPTGYGKSVIFQILPWFAQCMHQKDKPMTVIVVCPLTSLMQDQVLALRKSGINACSVSITGVFICQE
jgi:superfamily II DNA helicase RecQ